MRRCLAEAHDQSHDFKEKKMQLKNPVTGGMENVMHIEYALKWCIKFHASTWSSSTWKLTRLGYSLVIDKMLSQQQISKEKADNLKILFSQASPLKKSEREKKTSARRKKNISSENIETLTEYLSQNKNKWAKALLVWLLAGVATGLRPNEWLTAELKQTDDRLIVRTENFKANEKRSYAKHREIDITDLPERFKKAVSEHILVVAKMKELKVYEKYAKGCSDLLRLCNKKLWPRRKANIMLYTGRHQFSANAKADDTCSEQERAAMMGHKTVMTSRERYGRRKSGSKGLTPNIADRAVLSLIQSPLDSNTLNRKQKGS